MNNKMVLVAAFTIMMAAPAFGQIESWIYGSWEWVSTTYSSGVVETPATTGHTQQLEFDEDHTCRQYDDGVLTRSDSWRWSFFYEHIGGTYYINNMVIVGSDSERHWWTSTLSTLYLANAAPYRNPSVVAQYASRVPVPTESKSWGSVQARFR